MIIGSKTFYDYFIETRTKTRPQQAKRIADAAEWVVDGWYVLPEKKDGEFEQQVRAELIDLGRPNLLWVPSIISGTAEPIDTDKQSFIPLDRRPTPPTDRQEADDRFQELKTGKTPRNMPAAAKPPSAFQKVQSYWRAVSGPKVEQETFDNRLRQCTDVGGYTFSPFSARVTGVEGRRIFLNLENNTSGVYLLPEDESPDVEIGDSIQVGQIISKGNAAKPCPWLSVNGQDRHCTACGCGYRKAAKLDQKLWHANLKCPRVPPLFVEATIKKSNL